MKVSVIVPAFNEEERIRQAIEALLVQDYKDMEIIVVDNASTDNTFNIAKEYPSVTVLSEKNKGTNHALECGRLNATGEIIVRMDADCIPEKNWISEGVRLFDDPNVIGVTGPYDFYDAKPAFRKGSLFYQKYCYQFVTWLFQLLHLGAIMTGGNSMMRASGMEKIGGFDTRFVFYGDDTDVAKRLSKYGYVVLDPNLVLKTSARRFKNHGVLMISWLYFYHFMRVILTPSRKMKDDIIIKKS